MAEIKWTEEALRWLENIFQYIAEDNPAAAQKVIADIYEKAQILKTFPMIGFMYREEGDGEIRILLCGHYRITYFVKDDVAEILGIFHGAMNIENYLTY